MKKYVLSIDQGTTSSRAIIFDTQAQPVCIAQREFTQHFPNSGWVEHDANEIWSTQAAVCVEAIQRSGIDPAEIACIGITNQRETTVAWNKITGQPVYHAIVWQDRRTASYCDELRKKGVEPIIKNKTGLLLDAYFSASKIHWILTHVDEAKKLADAHQLCVGTIDSWLLWKLTQGKVHATDVSNASRTMLFNIHTLEWDDELLELFEIPKEILPNVCSSAEIYGYTQGIICQDAIPISGIAGDQQAALFGQRCVEKGMVKNTYGTGCFLVMNTGDEIINSQNRLISTIAWKIKDKVCYAIEGSIFIGGAVIQWLRDGLQIIQSSSQVEQLALTVKDNGGVYFVPALSGLGAPYWDPYARGLMIGLNRGTTAAHIARAAMESIAFQCNDVLECMQQDIQQNITELRVDGGATGNLTLMQFQSDISHLNISLPTHQEITSMGAAFLAGIGCGLWNEEELDQLYAVKNHIEPQLEEKERKHQLLRWKNAVERSMKWEEE